MHKMKMTSLGRRPQNIDKDISQEPISNLGKISIERQPQNIDSGVSQQILNISLCGQGKVYNCIK